MADYTTSYADDEEDRLMREYLAMQQGAALPAAEPPLPEQPPPVDMPQADPTVPFEPSQMIAQPQQAPSAQTYPSAPASDYGDPFEAYAQMQGQRMRSSYQEPPQAKERDDTWTWIAGALDLLLNRGENLPAYIAQATRPDNSEYVNYKRRNDAMNDASVRDARAQAAQQRMMPKPAAERDTLARERWEAQQARDAQENDPASPISKQTQDAFITAGVIGEAEARTMSARQLNALRPQLGQTVSQQRSFENASKGREQSDALARRRMAIADDYAKNRITYQDFLQQQRAIDEGEAKAETAAAETAPTSPKVVQDQSVAYGQEVRLRGIDSTEAALSKVEQILAQYDGRDIPGYGPVDGMKPDAMLGEEGRAVRAAVKELQDAKLREATGAAAPPSEAKTFGEIMGVGLFATEGDLRRGVAQARQKIDTQKSYVNEMYPSARQAGGVAAPVQRQQRRAVPRGPETMTRPPEDLPDDNLGVAPVPAMPQGARKPPKPVQRGERTPASQWEF